MSFTRPRASNTVSAGMRSTYSPAVTRPPVISPTVVAVDWSGARAASAQRTGICVAIASEASPEISALAGRTRVETIEWINRTRASFGASAGNAANSSSVNLCMALTWQR